MPEEMSSAQKILAALDAESEKRLVAAESFVRESGRASISALQRKFKIAYGSACRLMDELVARKVVSQIDHEGRRSILEKLP